MQSGNARVDQPLPLSRAACAGAARFGSAGCGAGFTLG